MSDQYQQQYIQTAQQTQLISQCVLYELFYFSKANSQISWRYIILITRVECDMAGYFTSRHGIFTSQRQVKIEPASKISTISHSDECSK